MTALYSASVLSPAKLVRMGTELSQTALSHTVIPSIMSKSRPSVGLIPVLKNGQGGHNGTERGRWKVGGRGRGGFLLTVVSCREDTNCTHSWIAFLPRRTLIQMHRERQGII